MAKVTLLEKARQESEKYLAWYRDEKRKLDEQTKTLEYASLKLQYAERELDRLRQESAENKRWMKELIENLAIDPANMALLTKENGCDSPNACR